MTIISNKQDMDNFFLTVKEDYNPTIQRRRFYQGVELPLGSAEAVKRLNAGYPWQDWGGVCLSSNRCMYVLPSREILLFSTVRRQVQPGQSETAFLASHVAIPNGQVKNFMNACRACTSLRGGERIAIIGSKAAEGGGIWHKYFALYLSLYQCPVQVDFFDYSEREKYDTLQIGKAQISMDWYPTGFPVDRLSDYHIVVDDVWSYTGGPGLISPLPGQKYSLKGNNEIKDGFVPFLHSTETRKINAVEYDLVITGCRCPLCREIKKSVRSYEQYLFLRQLCSRLGHIAPCVGIPFQYDLARAGDMLRALYMLPEVELTAQNTRYIMAVTEEVPVELEGNVVRQSSATKAQFLPMNRKDPKEIEKGQVFEWLEGRTVLFCGVASTILKKTRIKLLSEGMASPQSVDVCFVNSIDTWKFQQAPNTVYAPIHPRLIKDVFPDFQSTGRRVENYWEFVREAWPKMDAKIMTSVGQYCRNSVFPPCSIAPILDVSLTGQPLRSLGKPGRSSRFYTIAPIKGVQTLVPFESTQWRVSVFVNPDSTWGLLSKAIEWSPDEQFSLAARVMLPWDMTSAEIKVVEDRIASPYQPIHEYLRKEVGHVPWQIQTHTYSREMICNALQGQREFLLTSMGIIRTEMAHPAVHASEVLRDIHARCCKMPGKGWTEYQRLVQRLREKWKS